MLYFADYTRSILLSSSSAHRNRFSVNGVNSVQLIDDMEHIVPAPFFTIGDDIDARAILVLDCLKSGPVQQSCKLGLPELLLATVKRKAKAIEQ